MKREEFLKKREEYIRKENISNVIYVTMFFCIILAGTYLNDFMPNSWKTVYLFVFFGFLIGVWFLQGWLNKCAVIKSDLVYFSCKKPMFGEVGNIAVATGNCPNCGNKAFNE